MTAHNDDNINGNDGNDSNNDNGNRGNNGDNDDNGAATTATTTTTTPTPTVIHLRMATNFTSQAIAYHDQDIKVEEFIKTCQHTYVTQTCYVYI